MTLPRDPLPIDDCLPSLLEALERHRAVVLVAPPGAGKTTRVPLALKEAGWCDNGRIIMLEPRRIAARSAAAHMARNLDEKVGQTVGYRVRLDSKVSPQTRIEVVTEGVFTRMVLDDPELQGIGAVIFDEFHERSLDADLGLALAIEAQILREDLRLVVMSATINAAKVAQLLDDAPVVISEGRTFPVETHYVDRSPDQRLEDHVASVALAALREQEGSILIFLPGQAEIGRVAERLQERVGGNVDIAPLYGQLSPAAQDLAIAPPVAGRRKIVIATSVAETSLTIEGVRIVIDSGYARRPIYDPATGLTTLKTVRVSRAAADQRRGRAGRTGPGICYRLWHEGQTASLQPFDPPEILQADLTGLVLDLAGWGITDPTQVAFLDPPPAPAWKEAAALLQSLRALDQDGRITPLGQALARFPLHPRLAHMVHGAGEDDRQTAAELAVLIMERSLGGDDVDLADRLRRFRSDRSHRAEDARRLAHRLAARVSPNASHASGNSGFEEDSIGRHLARAYPDRVAQNMGSGGRGGGETRFRLANGRGALLDSVSPLAHAPYLVITDITGSAANGRIRAAASIDRATIEEVLAANIVEDTQLAFDSNSRAVRARRVRCLASVRLEDRPVPVEDIGAAAEILAAGIAVLGINQLPWTRAQQALRARSTYLARSVGGDWPDLSDEALGRDGAKWLVAYIGGRTSLSEITADDLSGALDVMLPWAQRTEIDRLLPSHFDAPSGSRIPIDYEAENGPLLAVRVQELFGLDRHPSIVGGRVPLLLVLLSPAHRPIQTTRDLPGFWRGSWRSVAKDLRGRYPKHYWPEDPLTAQATARAKPRGT